MIEPILIEPELAPKQEEALEILSQRSPVKILTYGGGVGGLKSSTGVLFQIFKRLMYAGSRGVIGRSVLKDITETTLVTFFETCQRLGLKQGYHYTYNQQSYDITFFNKSKILLKQLSYEPSDPNYERFGSLEIMDVFVDEAGQVQKKAIEILSSRCRHKLTDFCPHCRAEGLNRGEVAEYDNDERFPFPKPVKWICSQCGIVTSGLIPKILLTCNPNKNFLYTDYYLPSTKGELPMDKAFIQSLYFHNPWLSQEYIDGLDSLSDYDKKRLKDGDWNFDDDSDKLFNTFNLNQMFRNEIMGDGVFYITGDIARFGRDKTILIVWNGWTIVEMVELVRSGIVETSTRIQELVKQYNVRLSNVLLDEDGVGGGAVDITKARGFMNGSKAVHSDKYVNIKTECYYKLAEVIENGKLTILAASNKERIIKELETIKRYRSDADSKNRVTPKEEIKRIHGFSPDIADSMMMRAYFDLKPNRGNYVLLGSK